MSGGLAFGHDGSGHLAEGHNAQTSSAERLKNADEITSLRRLLEHWEPTVARFWKIGPHPPNADMAKLFLPVQNLDVIAA